MVSLRRKGRWALVAAALLLLGLLVYGDSLSGDFLDWDDESYTVRNEELRLPFHEAVPSIFGSGRFASYNPLHRLLMYFEWRVSAGRPVGFRVTSLLLHALASFLVFVFLAGWLGRELPAFLAAALFAVHPSNVENVAWISEQKSLLAACFGLGALILYLRDTRAATAGALALFTLGLLSKLSVVFLPVILPLLDLSLRRRPSLGRAALFLPPAVLVGVAQVLAAAGGGGVPPLHGGTPLSHAGTVVGVLPRYVQGLVFPTGLAGNHPFPLVRSAGDPRLLLGVGLLSVAAVVTVLSLRRGRLLLAAVPCFFAALLVTLVVPIPIIYAERFLYLAMPLLLGVAAAVLVPARGRRGRVGGPVLVAVGALLAVVAGGYAGEWKTSVSLWERVLEVHPDHTRARGMCAWAHLRAGNHEVAVRVFREYLAEFPEDRSARVDLAVAEYRAGRSSAALEVLESLVRDCPDHRPAWERLARLRQLSGDEEGARAANREAQRLAAGGS